MVWKSCLGHHPFEIITIHFLFRYVGNLDKRVTDTMMLNILKTGLSHIEDKILTCNMFHGGDMVCLI